MRQRKRRTSKNYIEILGAKKNKLKNIDVEIPLGVYTAITGVSESRKNILVKKIFYQPVRKN